MGRQVFGYAIPVMDGGGGSLPETRGSQISGIKFGRRLPAAMRPGRMILVNGHAENDAHNDSSPREPLCQAPMILAPSHPPFSP